MTDGDRSAIEAPTCLLCTDAAVAARKAQPSVFELASRARAQGGLDLELVADWLGADAPGSLVARTSRCRSGGLQGRSRRISRLAVGVLFVVLVDLLENGL